MTVLFLFYCPGPVLAGTALSSVIAQSPHGKGILNQAVVVGKLTK